MVPRQQIGGVPVRSGRRSRHLPPASRRLRAAERLSKPDADTSHLPVSWSSDGNTFYYSRLEKGLLAPFGRFPSATRKARRLVISRTRIQSMRFFLRMDVGWPTPRARRAKTRSSCNHFLLPARSTKSRRARTTTLHYGSLMERNSFTFRDQTKMSQSAFPSSRVLPSVTRWMRSRGPQPPRPGH